MLQRRHNPDAVRRHKTGNAWGELASLCRKVHAALYGRHDKAAARRYRHRLEIALAQLPNNDLAILRAEGDALLHELNDEIAAAIACRRKEIQLMTKLQRSVSHSIANGDYDTTTGRSILAGRDRDALAERRAIVRALLENRGKRGASSPTRLGPTGHKPKEPVAHSRAKRREPRPHSSAGQ
jgi:hypothetical protein